MRTMMAATATVAMLVATAGTAQAQMFIPNPHAYRGDGRFTLAGARAGVTVLGVDLDASANLKIGLHDRYRGAGGGAYAPPPPAYGQPVYAGGYQGGGYQGGGYAYGEGYSGGGYGYGERHATGYIPAPQPYYPAPPCGC